MDNIILTAVSDSKYTLCPNQAFPGFIEIKKKKTGRNL